MRADSGSAEARPYRTLEPKLGRAKFHLDLNRGGSGMSDRNVTGQSLGSANHLGSDS